jgi:uncharacterized protein YraI
MTLKAIFSAAAILAAGLSLSATPASARYCEGTVHGLSGHYNLATGSGYLAVRSRPRSSAPMIGQLFNGDHTTIFGKSGGWYQVEIGGATGWANAQWMWNSCNY